MEQKCLYCNEYITNPVCPVCIERNIKIWLESKEKSLVKRLPKFYEVTTKGVKCILCNSITDMCPYCYTEEVRYWLEQVDPSLLQEFLLHFNFGLKR